MIWVENARDSSDEVILQTWPEPPRPRSLIVVVDASQSIADRREEIVAGLGELARTTSLELLLAGDDPRWLGDAPEALRHESLGSG